MKVGIYINAVDKQIGGGYSYVKQVIKFFSSYRGKHDFIFIFPKGVEMEILEGIKLSNAVSFDENANEENVLSEVEQSGIQGALQILGFFSYRLKFKSVQPFIEILEDNKSRIRKKWQNASFEELCKEHSVKCVYYPQPEICKSFDVPFITTVWDMGHFSTPYFPETSYGDEYDRRNDSLSALLPRAFRVVRESNAGKAEAVSHYNLDEHKVVVAPQFPGEVSSLSLSDNKIDEYIKSILPHDDNFIFYPAQFWPHKNHVNLFRALHELKEKGIDIKLVLTGSNKGNWEYVSKYIKEYRLENAIVNLGFVDNIDLYCLYKRAQALVYPSMMGPSNMPIVEGLALSCPVVCSNLEGHQEQAESAAEYFDPADPSSIAESIKKVLEDETYRKTMILTGESLIKKKYDLQNCFKELIYSLDTFESYRDTWD